MLNAKCLAGVLGLVLIGCTAPASNNWDDETDKRDIGLAISEPTIVRTGKRSFQFEATLTNGSEAPICVDYGDAEGEIGINILSASDSHLLVDPNPPDIGLGRSQRKMQRVYGVIEPGQTVRGLGVVSVNQTMEFVDEKTMTPIRDYVHGEDLVARLWVHVFPCRLKDAGYLQQQRAIEIVTSQFVIPLQF
jgi:hypothetical protein